VKVENWGMISYQEALARQQERVAKVAAAVENDGDASAEESVVICTHPPVVTLGRGTKPGDVFGWAGETVEISRGGRATYHGPSQVVVYPILNLDLQRKRVPARDLHAYMRVLEQAIILTLREFGIQAGTHEDMSSRDELTGHDEFSAAKGAKDKPGSDDPSFTGVWVRVGKKNKKIASVGIGVKRWISYHGLALNVSYDPQAHAGIIPCGFQREVMTSMEEVLGKPIDAEAVQATLISMMTKQLQ
jgi:lipoate-protein ligase B